jgi:hypothetical protein
MARTLREVIAAASAERRAKIAAAHRQKLIAEEQKLIAIDRGETVDPASYYFRATPYFETSSEKYGWLNRICSIATGSRTANGRTLEVFQVL